MSSRSSILPFLTIAGPSGLVTQRVDKDVILIGRDPAADVVLADRYISRRHAEIRRAGASWRLTDLESRHGTRLNGVRVGPEAAAALRAGDRITVGQIDVLFETASAGAGPAAGAAVPETYGAEGGEADGVPLLLGRSPAILALRALAQRIGPASETVLITGESGTGKDVMARLIHTHSLRTKRPFVPVNCPALPGSLLEAELFGIEKGVATGVEARPGKFEAANGGTLFLDEIGDMEIGAQAKLLRVLQDRAVERLGGRDTIRLDVRVIAATNHDLEADVARGTFRRDLFHRLAVIPVLMPPLRERREDIPLLVDRLLRMPGGPGREMSPEALACLMAHDYPGNVRELENAVRRARSLAHGPRIEPADLPAAFTRRPAVPAGGGALAAASSPPLPAEAAPAAAPGSGSGAVSTGGSAEAVAAGLWQRLVEGGEDFQAVVRDPFLAHDLSRDAVRALITRGWEHTRYSYRKMAVLFHAGDYRRFLHFLRNHALRMRD